MSILKDRKELLDSFVESVVGDEPSASAGGKVNLDKDVSELLMNDLETKLLEILQESKKMMRHSKRHVLTTSDIDAAFRKLTIKVREKDMDITSNFPLCIILTECSLCAGDIRIPILSALCLQQGESDQQ